MHEKSSQEKSLYVSYPVIETFAGGVFRGITLTIDQYLIVIIWYFIDQPAYISILLDIKIKDLQAKFKARFL